MPGSAGTPSSCERPEAVTLSRRRPAAKPDKRQRQGQPHDRGTEVLLAVLLPAGAIPVPGGAAHEQLALAGLTYATVAGG